MTKQTTIGRTTYKVSPALMKRIKAAVKVASPGGALTWQAIAARPQTAEAFCMQVEAACLAGD